jgi:hypothetical protein
LRNVKKEIQRGTEGWREPVKESAREKERPYEEGYIMRERSRENEIA